MYNLQMLITTPRSLSLCATYIFFVTRHKSLTLLTAIPSPLLYVLFINVNPHSNIPYSMCYLYFLGLKHRKKLQFFLFGYIGGNTTSAAKA